MPITMSSTPPVVNVQKLYPDAILPKRQKPGDAAFDLYAQEDALIGGWEVKAVGTGIALEIPRGKCGLVTPRSGLAASRGLTVLNTPGLIDPNYRGEVKVLLSWVAWQVTDADPAGTPSSIQINKGDRIAQLLIVDYFKNDLYEVQLLSKTERGSDGLGSTGV